MSKSSSTVKATTTKQLKSNRKGTEFFQKKARASSPVLPPASSSNVGLMSSATAGPSTRVPDPEVISILDSSRSNSHISVSSDSIRSVTYISSDSHKSPAPHSVRSPPRVRSRYRSQTSNLFLLGSQPVRRPSPVKPSTKRKQMFDDSDVELLDNVIYIPKAPTSSKENVPTPRRSPSKPTPTKRQKGAMGKNLHYVPSSQSDEQELAAPTSPRDLALIKDSVQKWRKATASPQKQHFVNEIDNTIQEVEDGPTYAFFPSPNSEADLVVRSTTLFTPARSRRSLSACQAEDDYRPLSPPPSDPPQPLDTTQLIAQMKAEATAAALREEEMVFNQSMDFSELSSDDEDDDDDIFGLQKQIKHESTSLKDKPADSSSIGSRRSRRLMERSPSFFQSTSANTSSRSAAQTSQVRKALDKVPVVLTASLANKRPRASNPMTKLLREKEKANINGYGTEARLIAGQAITMEDFDDDIDDVLNLDALAVRSSDFDVNMNLEYDNVDLQQASATAHKARVEKLLGKKEGQAIDKILNHDRRDEKIKEKIIGIEFFNLDPPTKYAPLQNLINKLETKDAADPVMTVLCNAVNVKDVLKVKTVLDCGLFEKIKIANMGHCIQWLLNQVFTFSPNDLEESAYNVLSLGQFSGSCISFSFLFDVLVRMGVDRHLCTIVGLNVRPDIIPEEVVHERRCKLLYRWISVVGRFARIGLFQDGLDAMISLLLLGLDASSNSDLRSLVTVAIDNVGRSFPPEAELVACLRISKLCSQLSIGNQHLLVSLLGGGCSSTCRMSRWASFAALVGEGLLPTDHLERPLPLPQIKRLLAAPFDSGETFDIQNNELTDYEDLCLRIQLLSIALNDVDSYVKAGDDLESVCTQLTTLHGKIVDTRAAHLDRSRAKAALQRLSFRIRYQTTASRRSSSNKSRATLERFIIKK